MDLKTGRELWHGGTVGAAGSCLITKVERLIIWANNGERILAETAQRSPGKYLELAHVKPLFRHDAWPHLVLADGQFFLKDREGNVACFIVNESAR